MLKPNSYSYWSLSIFIVVFSFIRFTVSIPKVFDKLKLDSYLKILYFSGFGQVISAGILSHFALKEFVSHNAILFFTLFIATMTSGVMYSFAASPKVATLLGFILLSPYALVSRTYKHLLEISQKKQTIEFQDRRLRNFIDSIPGYFILSRSITNI